MQPIAFDIHRFVRRNLTSLLLVTCTVLASQPQSTVAQWDRSTISQASSPLLALQEAPLAPELNTDLVSKSREGKPQDVYLLLDTGLMGASYGQALSEAAVAEFVLRKSELLGDHGLIYAFANNAPVLPDKPIVKVTITNESQL